MICMYNGAEQSRAEQSRAEQSRAELASFDIFWKNSEFDGFFAWAGRSWFLVPIAASALSL